MRPVEQAGAAGVRAVVRAADDSAGWIIVAVRGVDVQFGEPHRPVRPPGRVGHGQKVEQQQALALVKPVIPALVLRRQHAELGQLSGHPLPMTLGLGQQVVRPAQQVQLRPVEERLVEVVHSVPRGQRVPVIQSPVGAGELACEAAPGMVEQVEQVTLGQCPAGRLKQRYRGRDVDMRHVTPS
jgi:hypothetical protein